MVCMKKRSTLLRRKAISAGVSAERARPLKASPARSRRQRLERGSELRESVRVSLAARQLLARAERLAGAFIAAERLQAAAELEAGCEVVGRAPQAPLQ